MSHSDTAKAIHDVLVTQKGGVCPAAECPICQAADGDLHNPEEPVSGKTYTEADFTAAVAQAVADATAPLQSQLDELKQTQTQSEIEAKITEALQPVKDELAEAKTKLDQATADLQVERAAREADQTFWNDLAASEAKAAEIESKKDARKAAAKSACPVLEDSYLDGRAEEWAAMADEQFETVIDAFKASAARLPENLGDLPPKGAKTALNAAEGDPGDKPADAGTKAGSALRSVMTRSGSK